jgi:hypothetical protein
MKLVKSKIELEIYDQKCELRKPTFGEAQEYRNQLKALPENEDASLVMKNFLVKMGLPAELFDALELGHVAEIMEVVTDSKKK